MLYWIMYSVVDNPDKWIKWKETDDQETLEPLIEWVKKLDTVAHVQVWTHELTLLERRTVK